jgi:hypothetical protein
MKKFLKAALAKPFAFDVEGDGLEIGIVWVVVGIIIILN